MASLAKALGVVWFLLAIVFVIGGVYGALNVEDLVDATEEAPSGAGALLLLGNLLIAMLLATIGSVAFVVGNLGKRDAAPNTVGRPVYVPPPTQYPAPPPYPPTPPYGSAT